MMKTKLAIATVLVWLGATSTDASACGGGMFVPPTSTATATGHRVVISMSSTQTVLWDQIDFNGNPSEFAWVLPVKKGAYLEVAADAFLEVLDAGTAVTVEAPEIDCPSSSGCTCVPNFGSASAGDGSSGDSGGGVTVVHQGTAGPYETVTLSTDAGNGTIADWLTTNGYAIPADIAPILDDYVAQDFDFIALKLKPALTIQKMKPVRVVTPGGSPTFPLRMLAAGAGDTVGLVLYVIAEGRIEASGFKNAIVPDSELSFRFTSDYGSNYGALRDEIFATSPDTFVTVSATRSNFLNPTSDVIAIDEYEGESIGLAYFRHGAANGEALGDCFSATFSVRQYWNSYEQVANPCTDPTDPTSCGALLPFRIDSRKFSCEGLTDLSVALTGLHPVDVWVTRLEARLPKSLLSQDLTLVPESSQAERPTRVVATKATDTPCEVVSANISGIRPTRGAAAIITALMGLFVTVVRRGARKSVAVTRPCKG